MYKVTIVYNGHHNSFYDVTVIDLDGVCRKSFVIKIIPHEGDGVEGLFDWIRSYSTEQPTEKSKEAFVLLENENETITWKHCRLEKVNVLSIKGQDAKDGIEYEADEMTLSLVVNYAATN